MIEIEYTRMIAACVAAFLLSWGCYVTAYTKHKNAAIDAKNERLLNLKNSGLSPTEDLLENVKIEKSKTFFFGYRLALIGLYFVAAAIGWALGWAVAQDHILTWVEDAAVAAAGAVIGGLILDKYIIHPIADGSFFEKVEDPIVQRFLQDAAPIVEDKVKKKLFGRKKKDAEIDKVDMIEAAPAIVAEDHVVPSVENMSFEEKLRLLEQLKKSL